MTHNDLWVRKLENDHGRNHHPLIFERKIVRNIYGPIKKKKNAGE
jgi:hypothetical protein